MEEILYIQFLYLVQVFALDRWLDDTGGLNTGSAVYVRYSLEILSAIHFESCHIHTYVHNNMIISMYVKYV